MNRFRWLSFVVLVCIQGIFSTPGGSAEPSRAPASSQDKNVRVAVVIGNSRYPSGALDNPKNDATAMAASLKKLGFDVELKLDASKADMDALFKRFSGKAEKAGVAAVFYAGHGVQVNGSNYIVPIDANPRTERDLKREMVKMDDVIDDMGDAKVKLVFFDACRDNPLSRSFSRGGSRGMAAPVEATGTLISFATKHGNTAADGEGKHSPYTAALLAALEKPRGVEIEQMLRRVQQGVRDATKGQQEPWRYGSLDGDFYFQAADAPADMAKVQQEAVDRAVLDAMRRANEQAAREKAELQQSTNARQEAADRAAQEGLRLANAQAARERAEFQQSIKAQQEASDRAVAEAIKRSNEQAARERAELQQSMEKMLNDALARQNAALEAESISRPGTAKSKPVEAQAPARVSNIMPAASQTQQPAKLASVAVNNEPAKAQTLPPPANTTPAIAQTQQPTVLASIATTNTIGSKGTPQSVLAAISNAPGDEWEYLSKDEMFGKQQKLVLRVKAVSPKGVLEEIIWNGNPVFEWVFGERAAAIGTPNESVFMFAPHWNGSELPDLIVEGGGNSDCTSQGVSCSLSMKITGNEKLTVAAGTFEAIRLDGWFSFRYQNGAFSSGPVTIWYSKDQGRLLKQSAGATGSAVLKFKETLELSAIRPALR